jgi:hypothetical protein
MLGNATVPKNDGSFGDNGSTGSFTGLETCILVLRKKCSGIPRKKLPRHPNKELDYSLYDQQ